MKSKYFWGIVLVVVGILFLGNNLEWWGINIFFKGWWSLFIIIPSIIGLFDKDSYPGSVIGLSLGILLLLASQGVIEWNMIWKILVPIIIIMIGISFIFDIKKEKKINSKSCESYISVFGENSDSPKELEDFKAISVFGTINLDLRKAKIKKDIVIEAVTIFGGIDIKVPDNVNLKITGVPIFGGVENKTEKSDKAKNTIYINYTCIFGGIDLI